MKIYYITEDNGDGSSSVLWYKTKAAVQAALDDEEQEEWRYGNEGHAGEITLPDDLDLSTTGIYFEE